MTRRRSVVVEGLHAGQPIPAASVVGNLLVSGGIGGLDPSAGAFPDGLDEQVAILFANVRRVVEAGGGSTDDIVRVTFYVRDRSSRDAINREWVEMFPDSESRPARHTIVYAPADPMLVQCDIFAVINDPDGERS